jgi:DNA modification methylase
VKIPLDQIGIVDRERKDFGDIPGLAAAIKETNGLLQPVLLTPTVEEDKHRYGLDPDEKPYRLVAGERRWRAHVFLGWDEIEAHIRDDLGGELEKAIGELKENFDRKDMEWHEIDACKLKIHRLRTEQHGSSWSQLDTAQELREDTGNVSRSLKVAIAIEKDPTLKGAGSRKAAMRMLDMREQLERRSIKERYTNLPELRSRMALGDARNWIRSVPTGSVDFTLTDPPYGQDQYEAGQKGGNDSASEYDDSKETSLDLLVDLVPQYLRITKPTGWLAVFMNDENYDYLKKLVESCCVEHFDYAATQYIQKPNGDWEYQVAPCCGKGLEGSLDSPECRFLRTELPSWLWYRPNSQNPTRMPERHAKNFYERILVVNRGEGRIFQPQCSNVLVHDAEYGSRIHAMQKPLALGVELISRFTLSGEVVCDPTFGSGAFLAGAAKTGRQPLGCEQTPLIHEQAIAYVATYYANRSAVTTTAEEPDDDEQEAVDADV